jgi:hypothetical protein
MHFDVFALLRNAVALMAGSVIGLAFGTLQQFARRRHEARERAGTLGSGWSLMPGAGARVAYLLLALALVQFICPLLFVDNTQWMVSAGVVFGYGWTLFRDLRVRLSSRS